MTQTIQYGDIGQGSIRTYSLVDHPFLWREELTMLDGLGRPKSTTVFSQGTAPADQVTSYTYANAGTLTSVTVPDPSVNTTATVTYTYTYDTLGRPLTIRRPDSPPSGVDLSYDGIKREAPCSQDHRCRQHWRNNGSELGGVQLRRNLR